MIVQSFSYKFGGRPARRSEYALALDARGVANPYVHGTPDAELRRVVLETPEAQRLIEQGVQYLLDHPTGQVTVGCSYGRHRSVAIADEIARRLGVTAEHTSRGSNGKPS